MSDLPIETAARKGVWLPVADADKAKTYDIIISDGQGYRWRATDCQWKRGGRIGKAGWYTVEEAQWVPVCALDVFRVTHVMEVADFPANEDIGRKWS